MASVSVLPTLPVADAQRRGWRSSLLCLLLALFGLGALFSTTLLAMVGTWLNDSTYSHVPLIPLISAWLIFERRMVLAQLTPRPAPGALLALAGAAGLWLLGDVLGIELGKQLGLVLMMLASCVAVLGWSVSLSPALRFPLFYLLLIVPVGTEFVPLLQEITANLTIHGLQLTGLPLYRDGMLISIPVGDFEVAEECSGVRFLIASVAMGLVYAHLSFRSWWRWTAFMALCVMIPVLANGLRAFGIIMLAHASNLQFAIGVDHLIYGWVFFALVMLLLIAIGQFMRDTADGAVMALPPQPPANTAPVWASLAVACLCLLPAALASAQSVRFAAMATTEPGVFALAPAAPWRETAPTSWKPVIVGAHDTWHNRYRAPGLPSVDLVVGYFTKQHQGAEVINSGHRLIGDPAWVRTAQRAREVPVHGRTVTVIEHEFTKDGAKRLLWSVAWVGGQFTGKPLLAKLHQGYAMLTGGEAAAALVLVGIIDSAAPMPEQRHALQAFIAASGDLGSALAQAGER